jgi:hypothetical protein
MDLSDASEKKSPATRPGIDPGTFRLVAQRLNHYATRLLGLWVWTPPGAWMSVSYECCVLSGRGLCVRLTTRPEESYQMWCFWVWSWILDNEEALAQWGLFRHGKKKIGIIELFFISTLLRLPISHNTLNYASSSCRTCHIRLLQTQIFHRKFKWAKTSISKSILFLRIDTMFASFTTSKYLYH